MTFPRLLMMMLICSAYSAAANPSPTLTTIYSFTCCTSHDGSGPLVPPVLGANGVLYGTTYGGGENGFGTVFSLTPPVTPGGAWTETILHSFQGAIDGIGPTSRLIIGPGGILYGTTKSGGPSASGVLYSLTPPSLPDGHWIEVIIHSFGSTLPNGQQDGQEPDGLIMNAAGVMFGTTPYGGVNGGGTVFALLPPLIFGGAWTYDVLYNFAAGGSPTGVVIGPGGILYGAGTGVVFALVPPTISHGPWQETVIHTFTRDQPTGTPVVGAGGVLYGTSASKDDNIYSLTPPASGGPWTEALVYIFPATPSLGSLSLGLSNTIFGTTKFAAGNGTAFVLKPPTTPEGGWTEVYLHMFTGGSDGSQPTGLTIGSGGILYGTTQAGGNGYGTVFALME